MNTAEYISDEHKIDVLTAQLEKAKFEESAATKKRRDIEKEIIDFCGVSVEGSTTFKGNEYKITTTGKITRTIDQDSLQANWSELSEAAKNAIRYSPGIIKKEFDALKKHNESAWRELCECMTEKEAKPSVTFSRIKTN